MYPLAAAADTNVVPPLPQLIGSVTVTSSNASSTLARPGDTVSLVVAFILPQAGAPSVVIDGENATAVAQSATVWSASAPLQQSDAEGYVAYSIALPSGAALPASSGTSPVYFDTSAPVITLNDPGFLDVAESADFTDPGATAFDTHDGTFAASASGSVDTSILGTTTITYTATDAAGNAAVPVVRIVTVEPTQGGPSDDASATPSEDDTPDTAATSTPDAPPAPASDTARTPTDTNAAGTAASEQGVTLLGSTGNGPIVGSFAPSGRGEVLGASTSTVPTSSTNSKQASSPQAAPEATSTPAAPACTPLLTHYLRIGGENDSADVAALQHFLASNLGMSLPVTGIFDQATFNAVEQFQLTYWQQVLAPWVLYGLPTDHTPTGYVYKSTLWEINQLSCDSLNAPFPVLP